MPKNLYIIFDLASEWVLDSSGWLRRLPLLLEKSPVYFRSTVEAAVAGAIVAKASAFYFISVMRSSTYYYCYWAGKSPELHFQFVTSRRSHDEIFYTSS